MALPAASSSQLALALDRASGVSPSDSSIRERSSRRALHSDVHLPVPNSRPSQSEEPSPKVPRINGEGISITTGAGQEIFNAMMSQQLEMGRAISALAAGQSQLLEAMRLQREERDRHPLSEPPTPCGWIAPPTPVAFINPPTPPPAGAPVPQLARAEVGEGVLAALQKHDSLRQADRKVMKALPSALLKKIDKVGRDFQENMNKYSKAIEREKRADRKTAFYADMQNEGKTPPGTKPFRLNESSSEFDEIWSEAQNHETSIVVKVSADATLRDAWRSLHFTYARYRDMFEQEASVNFAAKSKAKCAKASLDTDIREAVKAYIEDTSNKYTVDEELGLEAPVSKDVVVPEELVTNKVEALYAAAIQKLKLAEEKKKKALEKAEEKDKDTQEELLTNKPVNLMNAAIDKRVDEKLAGLGLNAMDSQGETAVEGDLPPADPAVEFCAKISKNGESPGVSSGHNQKTNPNVQSDKNEKTDKSEKPKKQKKQKKEKGKKPEKTSTSTSAATGTAAAPQAQQHRRPYQQRQPQKWGNNAWYGKGWQTQSTWGKNGTRSYQSYSGHNHGAGRGYNGAYPRQ